MYVYTLLVSRVWPTSIWFHKYTYAMSKSTRCRYIPLLYVIYYKLSNVIGFVFFFISFVDKRWIHSSEIKSRVCDIRLLLSPCMRCPAEKPIKIPICLRFYTSFFIICLCERDGILHQSELEIGMRSDTNTRNQANASSLYGRVSNPKGITRQVD